MLPSAAIPTAAIPTAAATIFHSSESLWLLLLLPCHLASPSLHTCPFAAAWSHLIPESWGPPVLTTKTAKVTATARCGTEK